MRFHIILTGLVTAVLASTASADGVSINPGLWEMTSTMTMTMMPQPQTTTVKECIKDNKLSPESFNMEEDNPCNVADVIVDGNTARWSINCPTEGGPVMEGQWEITSDGDTINGNGTMSTEFSGQQMGFVMTWEGKRIGNCE